MTLISSPDHQQTARRVWRPVAAGRRMLCAGLALALQPVVAAGSEPVFVPAPVPVNAVQIAIKQGTPASLILDDGSWEGTVLFPGQQFLWFNQFSLGAGSYELQEVSVLFPSGAGVNVGDAIQIAVWHDPDNDPTNGANLLTSFSATIQSVNGTTFSVYPVTPSVVTPFGGNLLVGVINRYVVGGVPAGTSPAAIDTSSSQGRSWYATWTTDPPDPPALPSDDVTALIDPFVAGNWMIRADGLLEGQRIPSQTPVGVAILIAAIAIGGALLLVRRG
jgi:hypothetical protein